MKLEKSIELLVGYGGSLSTSDGDVVFHGTDIPVGAVEGDIGEVRTKMRNNGKDVDAKPLFRRVDKATANSSTAVLSVLSSFEWAGMMRVEGGRS